MNWDDLRFFHAVAASTSISKAAKLIGVNQSTVFRRLQVLEKESNTRLFVRKRSGYTLTAEGQHVYEQIANAEPLLRNINQFLKDNGRHKSITIATFAAAAELFFPTVISSIEKQFSDYRFELLIDRELTDLAERQVDFAFRSCKEPPEHLIGKKIQNKNWSLYATERYLKNRPQTIDFTEHNWYKPFDFFAYPNLQQLNPYQWLYSEISQERIRPGANSLEAIASMCSAGLGVALLCDGISTQGLVKLATLPEEYASAFWLLYHPEQRSNPEFIRVGNQLAKKLKAVVA